MSNTEITIQTDLEPPINAQKIISATEKRRRAETVNNAIANIKLSGLNLNEEYKRQAQRFVNGEIELSDLLIKMGSDAINEPHKFFSSEECQRREDAVDYATASLGLGGRKLSPEAKAHAQRYVSGEINLDQYLAASYDDIHNQTRL